MPGVFTEWECEMAVWLSDEEGVTDGGLLWLGSCTNWSAFTQGFAEEGADISGYPWKDLQLLEQEHKVTLENLWALRDASSPAPRTAANWLHHQSGLIQGPVIAPGIQRGQRAIAVFVWQDEDSGQWLKRSYFNCIFNPFTFGSAQQSFDGKVEMRAGWMLERTGNVATEIPTLNPNLTRLVRYVSAKENIVLYRYTREEDEQFLALENTDGRAVITDIADGDHLFAVTFDGEKALGVTLDGELQCRAFLATGATGSRALPRLEFWQGPRKVATLSGAGEMTFSRFTVTDADPDLGQDFEFRTAGDVWLASLHRSGVRAPALRADLP